MDQFSKTENLNSSLRRFWDLETLGIKENEKDALKNFNEIIYLNKENRYEAKLPFREVHEILHDHFNLCEKRLLKLYSNLKNDTVLLKKYNDIFLEQKQLGIIEGAEEIAKPGQYHYIPHHPVIREDKNTKVRFVFDASAKSVGPSLNECLYKSPQLTPLIFDILVRFRIFEIALTSDIEKAFHQISVDEKDRNFLRFLWFDDFSDQPKIVRNRFARVIFDVTSSPFLLNQTIRKHIDIGFVQKVIDSFYVDDFTGGANNFEKALELYKKLKLRFMEGSLNSEKWRTNDSKLRAEISEPNEGLEPVKILGIIWDENIHKLVYDFSEILTVYKALPITKRNILKILAMFYDPIGLLQPIIINLKILFQKVCKQKLNWNVDPPEEIKIDFKKFVADLENLNNISIPRKILFKNSDDPVELVELHGFSDASYQNYGACVYMRSISKNGVICVNLVASKSTLAPIKKTTIPRLELLGNLLLSKLMTSVKNALSKSICISDCYFWTDSQVPLFWITSLDKNYKTFVENRVREIRKNTDVANWFYVDTKNNPPDLLTSQKPFHDFQNNNLWWAGASSLSEKVPTLKNNYLINDSANQEEILSEFKTAVLITSAKQESSVKNVFNINKFSTLKKLCGVTAWIFRFFNNLRKTLSKTMGL